MNLRNLLLGLFAVAALSACSGNDSSTPRATASGDAAIAPSDNGGSSYMAGTPYITYSKDSDKLWVDGAQVDEVNSETFAGYPTLEKNVTALRSTDKAIETKEQTLELWHGDSLFLALDLRGDMPMVITAPEGFAAERIAYARSESDQDQGMYTGSATFDLKECTVDQGGKDEGQEGKDQGQVDKGQDQGGKLIAGSDKGQDQGQDQDQGKQEQAPEVCKTSTVTLYFHEVKEAEKGQDQQQGKQEEPSKGQDQVDKGQDQGKQEDKDQGKQEDKNQGQQDKGQGQENK
jgi:hypothetical protein